MWSSLWDLNSEQLEKLSDLSLDLAKAAFILAFVSPTTRQTFDIVLFDGIRASLLGLAFLYGGLILLKIKEVKQYGW
ncbi:MAG: hypothetical protein FJ044_05235 [Candidatus Cloacimonetes bacterium]|nr:hypothetical protein [Candidatus Cloacimonadota bacterium]